MKLNLRFAYISEKQLKTDLASFIFNSLLGHKGGSIPLFLLALSPASGIHGYAIKLIQIFAHRQEEQ